MNSEAAQLTRRAIIRYLNGDLNECQALIDQVKFIPRKDCCPKCGSQMVKAKKWAEDKKCIHVELCTECGQLQEKVG